MWDALLELTGRLISWISIFLIALVLIDVLLRYLFQFSPLYIQEMEWHLFSVLFLLPTAWTARRDQHVRVDVLYQHMGEKYRKWVDALGYLFFAFPFSMTICLVSIPWVQQAWEFHEASPDPGGLPARYILKACIPVAYGILSIHSLFSFFRIFTPVVNKEKALEASV